MSSRRQSSVPGTPRAGAVAPAGGKRVRTSFFGSLRHRDFRFVWAGSLCSSFAMNIQQVARGWLIYEMTQSAQMLSWVMVSFTLPQVLLSLLGGALADRMPKKALMMGAQGLNCVAAILMAWIVFRGQVTFWHFIAMGLFNGTILALSMPSRQSIIPEIVGERDLMNAIALNSASMNLSRVLGPALAGGLIALFHEPGKVPFEGVGLVYVVIALLYFTGVATLANVRIEGQREDAPRAGVLREIAEAARYVGRSRLLLGIVLMGTLPMMFGQPMQSLLPAFNHAVLDGGPGDLGVLNASVGAGAILGTLLLARWGDRDDKGRMMFIGCALWGCAILAFSLAASPWLALPLAALAGVFSSSLMALNRTLMQLQAPPGMRGRIMSLDQMAHGLFPLGVVPVAWLADSIGVAQALQASAAMLLCITIVCAFLLPEVRRIDSGRAHHADLT